MHGATELLTALATVLGVAAVTTVVFQRLKQPVVLGYILAGLLVGPHVPFPLVADEKIVRTLSELGVVLLMFSLGLDFSLRSLVRVGPTAGITAVLETSLLLGLGYFVARAFGWTVREGVFAGAIVAISSTTIIAKAFGEQGIRGRLRDFVVGILVVEDLIAILLMAVLTAAAAGDRVSTGTILRSGGELAAFLAVFVVAGLLVVPRVVRAVLALDRPETTLVACMGICFGGALLAEKYGYSVALGAFLAGSLVSESGEERRIEPLVTPVRDVFAAVFFVSVGMLFDPAAMAHHGSAVAAFTGVVVVGKILGVSLGAFLTGNGIRTSVQAGMSLAQIGEFSFILAGLGLTLSATGEFLYPIAVAVSAITTLTTPWLIRASGSAANFVDRTLPRPLQTFAALYGSWIEGLRTRPPRDAAGTAIRRRAGLLLADALCLAALAIGTAVGADDLARFLTARVGLSPRASQVAVSVGVAALAAPFVVGILGLARGLGSGLAETSLPAAAEGKADLAAAPRRVLVVALQVFLVLVVGLPLFAIVLPFVPGPAAAAVVAAPLLLLGVSFWRSARDLEGHVRAGSEAILEALSAQARSGAEAADGTRALEELRRVLPGLGDPVALRLGPHCPAVGKTLADLNVRGATGCAVLVIVRDGRAAPGPTATEVLRAGDVLALAGSSDAVESAKALLRGGETVAPVPA
jgi:CPA2 family monovalent cation:H+ antiporter-2